MSFTSSKSLEHWSPSSLSNRGGVSGICSFFSESGRKRTVPSESLTTMGLRGRSNSEAEIFLPGAPGVLLSARAHGCGVGQGQDSEWPLASSLQAGMVWTRSANHALTISLRNTASRHVTWGRGKGLPANATGQLRGHRPIGHRKQKQGGLLFKTVEIWKTMEDNWSNGRFKEVGLCTYLFRDV